MFTSIKNTLAHPKPAAPMEGAKVDAAYKAWRFRVMSGMFVGYAIYYFCRKNFSMANKPLQEAFGLSATQIGMILSTATILYAFSKFFSGVLADRMNARYLMGFGLILSALMNILFGMSPGFAAALGLGTPLLLFIVFWTLSNLFQGSGVPPCSKMLTYWFSPKESGRAWGIWNASHQIGGALILLLSAYLVTNHGWQSAFFVPAAIGIVGGLFIIWNTRDTPQSMGLPPIEVYKGDASGSAKHLSDEKQPFWPTFKKHIVGNPMIWIVCIGNFFVYVVRISVLDWGPSFLQEAKGFSPEASAFAVSGFELSGVAGAFLAGYFSDKIFHGRRGPVMVIFMLILIGSIVGLLFVQPGQQWLTAGILTAVGFFVYGPQMLVAVAAADFATREAAATAVGLTGFFGYMGATVSGVGTGWMKDNYGWDGVFMTFIGAAAIGTILFLFTWNARSPMLDSLHQASPENGVEK